MNSDKEYIDYEEFVSDRITKLRINKNVASQAMSLEIGQSRGYISQIERKEMLPSMAAFFYICEFFNITPKEFFDDDIKYPAIYDEILKDLKELDENDIINVRNIIKSILKK